MLLMAACTAMTPSPQLQVDSLINVAPDKAVLVGRIELQPPLRDKEQVLKTSEGGELRNSFILYAGDRPRNFKVRPPDTFEDSFLTDLDREFFIKVDKGRTLYISGGLFYSVYDPPYRIESHVVSISFDVEILPDDEAVYIGTIQLVRDGNNDITSILIRDDYQWADDKYKARFGTRTSLRKALVAPIESNQGSNSAR